MPRRPRNLRRVGVDAARCGARVPKLQQVDRYAHDVLSPGWQKADRPSAVKTPVQRDMVLEEPTSGFVGAVVDWGNGIVVLEDRRGKRRSFPFGPNFWLDGRPVDLVAPPRTATVRDKAQEYNRTHTASGSRVGPAAAAKVALPSRIYVEGRHDAELVERVWGADLRHVGVVVEYLGGIDDLPAIVRSFAPTRGRRLGVLVDHLVPGSKESRIVEQIRGEHVFVTGHRFIDIWAAVKPARLGIEACPTSRVAPTGRRARSPRSAGRTPTRPTSRRAGNAFSRGWRAGRISTRGCSPRSRN